MSQLEDGPEHTARWQTDRPASPMRETGVPPSAVLGAAGPCHVGMVVTDLNETMESMAAGLGLTWATPQKRSLDGWTPAGPLQVTVAVTWSHQGPAHVELIEGPPATLWATSASVALHHVAYWSADLAGDVARLAALGYQVEVTGAGGGGAPASFAYMTKPAGLRIELMGTDMKPAFDAWLAGGNLPPVVR